MITKGDVEMLQREALTPQSLTVVSPSDLPKYFPKSLYLSPCCDKKPNTEKHKQLYLGTKLLGKGEMVNMHSSEKIKKTSMDLNVLKLHNYSKC